MQLNILGTEYGYKINSRDNDPMLDEADGYCNPHSKVIVVVDENGYRKEASDSDDSIKDLANRVSRHEIVHAYFAESGLREYCDDEQLVDWIAWQFPRMLKTIKEVGAI